MPTLRGTPASWFWTGRGRGGFSRRGPAPQSFWLPECLLRTAWFPPTVFILDSTASFWTCLMVFVPRSKYRRHIPKSRA